MDQIQESLSDTLPFVAPPGHEAESMGNKEQWLKVACFLAQPYRFADEEWVGLEQQMGGVSSTSDNYRLFLEFQQFQRRNGA